MKKIDGYEKANITYVFPDGSTSVTRGQVLTKYGKHRRVLHVKPIIDSAKLYNRNEIKNKYDWKGRIIKTIIMAETNFPEPSGPPKLPAEKEDINYSKTVIMYNYKNDGRLIEKRTEEYKGKDAKSPSSISLAVYRY